MTIIRKKRMFKSVVLGCVALCSAGLAACSSEEEPVPVTGNADAPVSRSLAAQSDGGVYEAKGTMRFALGREEVAHVALSKKDYIDYRECPVDYDFTMSPIPTEMRGVKAFTVRGQLTVHSGRMWTEYTKKHGLVSVRIGAYLMQRVDLMLDFGGSGTVRCDDKSHFDPWIINPMSLAGSSRTEGKGGYEFGQGGREGEYRAAWDATGLFYTTSTIGTYIPPGVSVPNPPKVETESFHTVANWIFSHKRNSCPLLSDDVTFTTSFTVYIPEYDFEPSAFKGRLTAAYFSVDRTTLLDGNKRDHSNLQYPDGNEFYFKAR